MLGIHPTSLQTTSLLPFKIKQTVIGESQANEVDNLDFL